MFKGCRLILILLLLCNLSVSAQKMTKVKGVVIDANTKEPLPFVSVNFVGTNVGTTTDFDGNFYMESQWASNRLLASFVGYNVDTLPVIIGTSQTVNFSLTEKAINIEAVNIVVKKKRYKNKGNPATAIMKNVIKNKKNNRKESLDYYEYDKYEKVEFDLNNITKKFKNRGYLKKFQFVFDYVDTSNINGKPYLPIFLRETSSKIYYRSQPKSLKEYCFGTKITGFEDYVDDQGTSFIMDKLYADVNIYDNDIYLLSNQFISPISSIALSTYKYFIIDTTVIDSQKCINLAFLPRNKFDFAFKGNLYVLEDSTNAIVKVEMSITDEVNLNFVTDISIEQEFKFFNNQAWMLTKDEIIIDYSLNKRGIGMYGRKSASYKDYVFNSEKPDTIYKGVSNVIKMDGYEEKDETFWEQARHNELTKTEEGVYEMIDSIQEVPAFKRTMEVAMIFFTGYKDVGPIDIGPIAAFYSFNDVEGFRLRVGGRTNLKFHKKIFIDSYLAYGFKDEEFKYSVGIAYSFNKDHLMNPQHRIGFSHEHETAFPGANVGLLNNDNIFLSFRRGNSSRMLFYDSYKTEYLKEFSSGFSFQLSYENKKQKPWGSGITFQTGDFINPVFIDNIITDEVSIDLRFAPNEQFYQGKNYRLPLVNKYPVFKVSYNQGIKGLIDGQYEYTRLSLSIFKRFYLSPIGYTDAEIGGGKVFGTLPFPLLNLPQANQSFAYQARSYNLMNFLEFISDEYASINIQHFFNGAIFNKIPLLKRLKFREVVTFKAIYGQLSDANNPNKNSDAFKFPFDENNQSETFSLEAKPYMETSVGVANILKFLRIDIVKRLTYLDNPNISELWGVRGIGIRSKIKLDF